MTPGMGPPPERLRRTPPGGRHRWTGGAGSTVAAWFGRCASTLACALIAGAVSAADPVVTVVVEHMRFEPASVVVKAGTVVRWVNREKRTSHSVLFTGPDGFESERFLPDEQYERRFDRPGRYAYVCGPHPDMKGVVEVTP